MGSAFTANLREDMAENIDAFAALGAFVAGGIPTEAEQEAAREGLIPLAEAAFEEGVPFGEQALAGMLGGTAAELAGGVETFYARPFTSFFNYLGPVGGALKMMKAGAKAPPRVQKAINTMAEKSRAILATVGDQRAVEMFGEAAVTAMRDLRDHLPPAVSRALSKEGVKRAAAAADRFFRDPTAAARPEVQAFLREVMETGGDLERTIRTIGEDIAREALREGGVAEAPAKMPTTPEELAEAALSPIAREPAVVSPETGGVIPMPTPESKAPGVYVGAFERDNLGIHGEGPYPGIGGGVPEVQKLAPDAPHQVVEIDIEKSPELQGLSDEAAKAIGIDPAEMGKHIDEALSTYLPQVLRSPSLQKELKRRLMGAVTQRGLRGKDLREFERTVDRVFPKPGDDPPVSYQLRLPDGGVVDMLDFANRVVGEKGEFRRQVVAEASQAAVASIAGQARKARLKEAVKNEYGQISGLSDADRATRLGLSPSEVLPVIIDFDPKVTISGLQELARTGSRYAEPKAEIRRIARGKAAELSRYVPMDRRVADYLGIPPDKKMWLPPEANSALKAEEKLARIMDENGVMNRLNRYVKANLTARNLGTLINNVTANTVLQVMRTGELLTPLKIAEAAAAYGDWKKGVGNTPGDRARIYKALDRANITKNTLVSAELGGPTGLPGLKTLEKIYQKSDTWFRLHEAERVFKQVDDALKTLRDGEYIDLEVGTGNRQRITKDGDSFSIGGKKLDADQLDAVIGRASVHHGNKLFFDYSKKPQMLKALQAAPIIGMASPFLTWQMKAFALPFQAIRSNPVLSSNSSAVNRQMIGRSTGIAIRRAALLKAGKEQLPEDREKLKKVLAWLPGEQRSMLFDTVGGFERPGVIGVKDLGSISFAGPMDLLLRAGQLAEVKSRFGDVLRTDPATIEDPKERKIVERRQELLLQAESGQTFGTKTVAELFGLAGGPIIDAWNLATSESRRNPLGASRIYRELLPLVLPGVVARGVDVGLGLAAPEMAAADIPFLPGGDVEPISTRQFTMGGSKPSEADLDWTIRKLFSFGTRPMDVVKERKEFFKEAKASLIGGLERAYDRRINTARKAGDIEDVARMVGDRAEKLIYLVPALARVERDFYTNMKSVGLETDLPDVEVPGIGKGESHVLGLIKDHREGRLTDEDFLSRMGYVPKVGK